MRLHDGFTEFDVLQVQRNGRETSGLDQQGIGEAREKLLYKIHMLSPWWTEPVKKA